MCLQLLGPLIFLSDDPPVYVIGSQMTVEQLRSLLVSEPASIFTLQSKRALISSA